MLNYQRVSPISRENHGDIPVSHCPTARPFGWGRTSVRPHVLFKRGGPQNTQNITDELMNPIVKKHILRLQGFRSKTIKTADLTESGSAQHKTMNHSNLHTFSVCAVLNFLCTWAALKISALRHQDFFTLGLPSCLCGHFCVFRESKNSCGTWNLSLLDSTFPLKFMSFSHKFGRQSHHILLQVLWGYKSFSNTSYG